MLFELPTSRKNIMKNNRVMVDTDETILEKTWRREDRGKILSAVSLRES